MSISMISKIPVSPFIITVTVVLIFPLLYILNGTAEIIVGGVKHTLVPGEFIVVDSNQIHESQCALASMGVTVHVSKEFLESYIEDTALPGINCMRDTLQKEKLPNYLEICNLFKKLVPMYIQHPAAMRLGSDAIVMEILFHLINHFSYQLPASQIPRFPVQPKTKSGFKKSFYM